jgi:hypothetical protein
MNTKTADLWKCVDLWKKMQHANIVQLREVFTTKAFGDHCELTTNLSMKAVFISTI